MIECRDGLAQTVLFGNPEVDDRARFVSGHLNHADDVIGPVERPATVGGRFDGRRHIQRLGHFMGDNLRRAQPLRVDVHQRQGTSGQFRETEDVTDQILGEDGAPRADEGDFGHQEKSCYSP